MYPYPEVGKNPSGLYKWLMGDAESVSKRPINVMASQTTRPNEHPLEIRAYDHSLLTIGFP